MAIPTKLRRDVGTRRTESAARQSTFLRKPIGLAMFSAGNTLGLKSGSRTAAAPDCAKETKVEAALRPLWTLLMWVDAQYLLPNLAITAIPESPPLRPAVLGYTERPARVQFMLGQVGLYEYHISTHERPDSKRPQALKSRVAAREAVWKRALPAVREAVWKRALPAVREAVRKRHSRRVATREAERKPHCGRVSGERSGTACLWPWTRCRPARTRACAPRRHRGSGSSSRRRSEPRRQTCGRTARPRRCPP